MKSEKIVIICQGSANEQFTKETEYLFRSINEYGGKLANAEKIPINIVRNSTISIIPIVSSVDINIQIYIFNI